MFTLFFSDKPVENFADACSADLKMFNKYFKRMIAQKIYIAPSAFEAAFVSLAHTRADITKTLEAIDKSLKAL
jgi:glutamate-1-semialdehyde 2,1-aminomutase